MIATTRPETMLGDTAIAVHPDDERYKVTAVSSFHSTHDIFLGSTSMVNLPNIPS